MKTARWFALLTTAALADVLFGDYNPAGRLPIRFYQSERQLPPFGGYNPGERKMIEFTLTPRQLSTIGKDNRRVLKPGVPEVSAGGKQPGFRGAADASSTGVLTGRFKVPGTTK